MMKHLIKSIYKAATIVMIVATLCVALFIMANHMGLADNLDFGAGAYYYADIPDFDRILKNKDRTFDSIYWICMAIFIIWGVIIYKIWEKVEK